MSINLNIYLIRSKTKKLLSHIDNEDNNLIEEQGFVVEIISKYRAKSWKILKMKS